MDDGIEILLLKRRQNLVQFSTHLKFIVSREHVENLSSQPYEKVEGKRERERYERQLDEDLGL